MAHLGGGKAAIKETGSNGEFKRRDSSFRKSIKKGSEHPPEAGRYHLYLTATCPWANRTLAVLKMKGLDHIIGVSATHPTWQKTKPDDPNDEHYGWTFANPGDPPFKSPAGYGSFSTDECIPDTVNNPPVRTIRDLYEKTSKDYDGKFTVPVLWDKKTSTIVNNESSDIVRILNSKFNEFAKHPNLDLYPEALRGKIDSVNSWVYSDINNGVYKCGFAQTQAAYETAFDALFAALDKVEEILSTSRYLTGDQLTEADVRLFMTLIRFDECYVVYFKTNHKLIREYPNMREYTKDVYRTPGIGETINIPQAKIGYFSSHPKLNAFAIIPKGGEFWWEAPHNRAKKFK